MSEPEREADQLDGVLLPEHQPQLVGHESAYATLRERLTARRLPGGVLLHGPLGIGKATLAFALAKEILLTTGDEPPERVLEQISAGSHPNLFVLRRQPRDTGKGYYTVIRVDEIRDLRERLQHTRGRAGHRVAIINSIDDCNPQAANALLKTLEEPPAETLFLLVSHRPGQLLPTIRSRCHNVALRPLADHQVHEVLSANRPGESPDAVDRAVGLAHGRPRRAFEALLLSDEGILGALKGWLETAGQGPSSAHIAIADALAANPAGAEAAFARDVIFDWLAAEAHQAALGTSRARLASATELWDKADALLADADELNIDFRQTLVVIFDAIRAHRRSTAPQLSDQR